MAEVDLNELERYLRIYQENPDSRVFAPLADLYRRLGKLDDAEEICREGIRRHPYYAGGRVALAHVLLDKGQLKTALQEADSVVTYYPDNLLARKILIRVLGGLGETDRARREFEAFKHLAPAVAGDPELEKALQGPAGASRMGGFPAHPADAGDDNNSSPPVSRSSNRSAPASRGAPMLRVSQAQLDGTRHLLQDTQSYRATQFRDAPDLSPSIARSQKLATLVRKRLVLESLIEALGRPAKLS